MQGRIMSRNNRVELEADLLTLLAQPTRLKILYYLKGGERCACHINPQMQEDPSVISRHLVKMREAGLLESRKEGVSVYYKIKEPRVFNLLEMVDNIIHTIAKERADEILRVF
ncbi:transcriptional regulator [candidate division LCP-89 bacterium B3_LCP]|uniref:Transcriptional regulator n=1 Tax=candidate division LCP-89 bacterium B3_LCP TaxID=2012998 RepID=A0A532V4Q3_UNCL8|nr:MAG: transcriptional regulator [candidate division LCP-89 bacterium B3_LCP]